VTEDARRPPHIRQTPSIGPPPAAEALAGFPVWHVLAGTVLCRVTSAGFGPWWFSSDEEGRFDLVPPRGTCYLADDDTTVRAARGFGVTGELASMVPYDLPQRWAAAFAAAGYQGVRYRIRHDPGGSRALALFGAAGERRWPQGRSQQVAGSLLARLASEAGVRVAPIPAASDLPEVWD
jgi:hypothetical protein